MEERNHKKPLSSTASDSAPPQAPFVNNASARQAVIAQTIVGDVHVHGNSPSNEADTVDALIGQIDAAFSEFRWSYARQVAEQLELRLKNLRRQGDVIRRAWIALARVEDQRLHEAKWAGRPIDVSRLRQLREEADRVVAEPNDEQMARLASLKASEVELTEGPRAALASLGAPADPIRTRTAIAILLRDGQYRLAADLINDRVPDPRWVDLAACAFACVGDFPRAQALIQRADEEPDLSVMRRTRLGFAEGILERWRDRLGDKSLLTFRDWNEADQKLAATAVANLDRLLSKVCANRGSDGDLDLGALSYAVTFARILGDDRLMRDCTGWLLKHVPVPLLLAELSLSAFIECPKNLAGRLRLEHHGDFSFRAGLLAALVDRELLNSPQQAFDSFVQLATSASTESEKESLCTALFETSGMVSANNFETAIRVVTQLRPNDQRMPTFLHAARHIANGRLSEAREVLQGLRDESDGVWWQMHAQLCEKSLDEDGAHTAWEKASELVPHPEVVGRSIRASLNRRRYESAVRGLKKLLARAPDSVRELKGLGTALAALGDYPQAAEYIRRLVDIEPTHSEYRLWLAQCLARSNQLREAISALTPACETPKPPLQAMMLQSELLAADGRERDALWLLQRIAPDHWDDPRFLLVYMHRAYGAGDDQLGSEAFQRLVELSGEGRVPPDLMQQRTLEQFVDHAKKYREQRESLQTDVVAGRMPWLFAEDVMGNAPTWAWTVHTQELKWLVEDPLSRAAYTIYATNGFTVCAGAEGKRLEPIETSPFGSEVVADITALLTLHQLGRLRRCADYFGKLLLPASYGDMRIRDAGRYGNHQPSRENELRLIRRDIDRGRIRVVEAPDPQLIELNEYSHNSSAHFYHLRDLIAPLQRAQKVSPEVLDQLQRVAHKPITIDEHHAAIQFGAHLLVDLATLRTLAKQPIFDAIVDNFSICIEAAQRDELLAELQSRESAKAAKHSNESLWDLAEQLINEGKVELRPVRSEATMEDDLDSETPDPIYLDSLQLALQSHKPILVDDRVIQVMAYQQRPDVNDIAFGSDRLLVSLLAADASDESGIAADFRRLMRWRYRFLVPPPRLLINWARASVDNLPGDALLDVGAYLHDCLRDPGLHCGLEESTPPMPMAAKLVTSWIDTIVTFLADVWGDGGFTDVAAGALTHWVGAELIPSNPRGLWLQEIGANLARAEPRSALLMAMVQFTRVRDQRRANLGLRTLGDALGLTLDEFLTAATEAARGVLRKPT